MEFKGFQGTTLLDFPGRVASIFFTGGCSLKCPYCHNMELVENHREIEGFSGEDAMDMVEERVGFIDGIVITGGEPTIHDDLPDFATAFKGRYPKLHIKLDTNGCHPVSLRRILKTGAIDMVAMDVKTSPDRYPELLGHDSSPIIESISVLKESGISREFRTTCLRGFVGADDAIAIGRAVGPNETVYLQRCIHKNALGPSEVNDLALMMSKHCRARVRGF